MQLEVGSIVEGKVTGITKFGAFIELAPGTTGMVHISEIAPTYVKEIKDHVTENQMVKVKVLAIGEDGKISLSIKKAQPAPAQSSTGRPSNQERSPYNSRPNTWNGTAEYRSHRNEPVSFEDMLSKFKQMSEEKMSDLKRSKEAKRGGASPRRSGQRG